MIARERGGYIGKEKPKVGDGFPESFGMIAPQEKFPRRFFSLAAEFFEANSHRLTVAEFGRGPHGAGARENLREEPGQDERARPDSWPDSWREFRAEMLARFSEFPDRNCPIAIPGALLDSERG